MDSNVLIALVIVVGIVVIVFLMRDRITEVLARGSVDKREGEVRLKAAKPQPPQSGEQAGPPPSIDITGALMVGKNRLEVNRDSVRVKDAKMLGENEIGINAEPPAKPTTADQKKK